MQIGVRLIFLAAAFEWDWACVLMICLHVDIVIEAHYLFRVQKWDKYSSFRKRVHQGIV
jgi:hypothetical protein